MPDAQVVGIGAIGNEVAHTAPVGFVRSHVLGTIIEQFNEAAERIVNLEERRAEQRMIAAVSSPEFRDFQSRETAAYVRSRGLEPAGDGVHLVPIGQGISNPINAIVPPLWNKDP